MINLVSSKKIDLILPNTNKALKEILNSISPKELESISKGRDLKSILDSILKQSSFDNSNDKILLQLLKNNPTLKGLGDVSNTIKELLNTIKLTKNTLPLEQSLKNILVDIKDLKDVKLQQKFENSGVFLESRLKDLKLPQQNIKEFLHNDLKSALLLARDEITSLNNPNKTELLRHIDKLALQIDYYQLLSHLSNSSSLYLPFSWEGMQEGSIEMKKVEDKFYCDIDLKLKEYGEIKFKLTLYEKNQLNLHVYTTSKEFQNIIKDNLSQLRSAIFEVNVTPREIRIFEPKETNASIAYTDHNNQLDMNFEVKV